jgi:mRNA-degrading endonuclease RelE of RelBE toxin-antitoxin system
MRQRYRIIFLPTAEKSYLKLARSDKKLIQRFDQKLQELSEQPYPSDVIIIKRTNRYDLCRSKVGQSWRILYAVAGNILIVLIADITSRESAYGNIDTLLSRVENFLDDVERGDSA